MKLDKLMAAVVTGGASGLGEATARMLAANGAKVAILDMNAERGDEVAREIGAVFCTADVTDEASIDSALAQARAANGIERILINCAGIAPGKRTVSKKRETGELVPHDLATFRRAVEVNLIGTFHMIAKSAAAMATRISASTSGYLSLSSITRAVTAPSYCEADATAVMLGRMVKRPVLTGESRFSVELATKRGSPPVGQITAARFQEVPSCCPVGGSQIARPPARMTSSVRGPCTPRIRVISMSAVADGPEIVVTSVAPAAASPRIASGTVCTTCPANTTQRW